MLHVCEARLDAITNSQTRTGESPSSVEIWSGRCDGRQCVVVAVLENEQANSTS